MNPAMAGREKICGELPTLPPQRGGASEGGLRVMRRSPPWLGRGHCLMILRDSASRLVHPVHCGAIGWPKLEVSSKTQIRLTNNCLPNIFIILKSEFLSDISVRKKGGDRGSKNLCTDQRVGDTDTPGIQG